jgi:hypothetical protein
MTTSANVDLLLRQRTFSIDETREQLRQGRAVQREAIIAGAVDIESMHFGDSVVPSDGVVESQPVSAQPAKPAAPKVGGSWAGVLMKSGPTVENKPLATTPTPKKTTQSQPTPVPEKNSVQESSAAAETSSASDDKKVDQVVKSGTTTDKKNRNDRKNGKVIKSTE